MSALSSIITNTLLVAGTAVGVKGQLEQKEAADEANDAAQARADLEAKRSRRNQIRELMIKTADAKTNATASGAQFGSGIEGGVGAATSTTNSNLLAIDQGQELGQRNFAAQSKANRGSALSSFGASLKNSSSMAGNIFAQGSAVNDPWAGLRSVT